MQPLATVSIYISRTLTFQNNFKLKYIRLSLAEMMQTGLQNPSGSELASLAARYAQSNQTYSEQKSKKFG
jgi:hypothetical protein